MMDTLELAMTQVKSQVEKYMRNTQKQLEAQSSILEKETELGELTIPAVAEQFKKLLSNVKGKSGSVKDVANMYGILQQKERVTMQEVSKLNGKLIQHSMDSFQEHIEKRKSQIDEINQLLPALDKIMCSLTGEDPTHSVKQKNETNESSNRMSKFMNRVKGIFGS